MEFTVYRARNGSIVLVPECLLPTLACEHEYGPLLRHGTVTVADARCVDSWRSVMREIEIRSFALLDRKAWERLFGEVRLEPPFPLASVDSATRDSFDGVE